MYAIRSYYEAHAGHFGGLALVPLRALEDVRDGRDFGFLAPYQGADHDAAALLEVGVEVVHQDALAQVQAGDGLDEPSLVQEQRGRAAHLGGTHVMDLGDAHVAHVAADDAQFGEMQSASAHSYNFV